MQLLDIDKARFKKHLNWFQASMVVLLMILALGLSELFIALWSDGGSNFWLNVAAVALAAMLTGGVVSLVRHHPALAEVMYVWQLKQELNRIYRSSKKLAAALERDKPEALIVHYFQLHGSKHLYQLEDNTLTLEELNVQIQSLDERLANLGMTVSIEDYQPQLLARL